MIPLPFNIKIALSRRKKAPVLYMFEQTFLPHQLLHLRMQMRWVKVIHKDDKGAIIELHGQQIKLLSGYFIMLATEWKIWERYYLPNFSLDGKTVLDIGAGCGETAFFYLLNGARKIVAIEPNREATECLKENAKRNNWNVEIIQEAFKLQHFNIPHDFMKMDIEGHEKELLKIQYNKPCIVEVHSDEIRRKFEEKGFKTTYTYKKGIYISFLYTKVAATNS